MEQKIIDLREFRKNNNLSQKELAEFLGITGGFISLIENGRAKLPNDKLERLLVEGKAKGWNTSELIPASSRILMLGELLQLRSGVKDIVYEEALGLSSEDLTRIITGQGTFTRTNVEQIRQKVPDINVNWLMTGEGDVFMKEIPNSLNDEIYKELQAIRSELKEVKEAIQQLTKMIH